MLTNETIIAQATPPGRGGVGIIRISGPKTELVAQTVLNKIPTVRKADYLSFLDEEQQTIDQGIAILFKAPNSFTGEDVLELQGHGGPVIMDMLMRRILQIDGIRMARPGEFSERAFLNDKMDLTQAEAIADLIDATSERAVKSAMNSLQGEFSKKINTLTESLIHLRIYVEAAIDFPEEEVDFLADGKISQALYKIMDNLSAVQKEAKQGAIIREGMKVVIAGRPNAGKSSLLNALAGKESAIVTDIAGTTRDVLREHIHIDGMPLHIIDTAGLRDSPDRVEQIGIERAWEEINNADQVLFMVDGTTTDATDPAEIWPDFIDRLPSSIGLTVIRNKMDLTGESPTAVEDQGHSIFKISAKENLGLDELKDHLKQCMGYQSNTEGGFIARRRHLDAIEKADEHLQIGKMQMEVYMAGELLAEELRLAQEQLSEITGEFSSDDLLGRIFTSFCIGK
ncbi:tRNA uridine-5-carboxymethylaminomethyl(34) synthesis GTPase MnmE [Moritella sp. Urea-trap-13]|uniref:tRNA uridine-5-carboxymethylaminomethyl(34) synthesis GTPase MnmE n=1 Tax=Moritella sp. Urea-trap-13 TaxID=2058327 RepID=UPI000C331D88|nr:tRNA uridine-5-carboxymethylaminomethyl(34) synthesis GTPase MnmE [Moritella sp. Urea-trap-13]PKH05588.1 tRNA uridine-5-carboxymethylaminomethyl(34) synthesis GTPase MnmE [Moritella sp. Urea-trap-13]